RAPRRFARRAEMVAWTLRKPGNVSLAASVADWHRARVGRLGSGRAAGVEHHPRPTMGRLLPADFWPGDDCGHDADYRGDVAALFLRGNPLCVVESRAGYRLRPVELGFRTLCGLPDRHRRRPLHQPPDVVAEVIPLRHQRTAYGFFAMASSTVLKMGKRFCSPATVTTAVLWGAKDARANVLPWVRRFTNSDTSAPTPAESRNVTPLMSRIRCCAGSGRNF